MSCIVNFLFINHLYIGYESVAEIMPEIGPVINIIKFSKIPNIDISESPPISRTVEKNILMIAAIKPKQKPIIAESIAYDLNAMRALGITISSSKIYLLSFVL